MVATTIRNVYFWYFRCWYIQTEDAYVWNIITQILLNWLAILGHSWWWFDSLKFIHFFFFFPPVCWFLPLSRQNRLGKYHMKNELINEIIKRNQIPADVLCNANDLSFEFCLVWFWIASSYVFSRVLSILTARFCVSFCLFMHLFSYSIIIKQIHTTHTYIHTYIHYIGLQ